MNPHEKTTRMVMTAVLMALVVLLGLTPIGLIPLGFIYITTLCIPVIAGSILFGYRTGLLLGACFGAVSTFKALTAPSALVATLLAKSPALVIALSLIPRLLVPLAACLAYRLVSGNDKRSKKAIPVAALCGSLTNTVFYLGLMLLFYAFCGIDSSGVLALIGGTSLIAGGCEAVAAALILTPVIMALWKSVKHI